MTNDRKCLVCEESLMGRHSATKYCSLRCKNSKQFWGTYCIQCSSKILVSPSAKHTEFCSWDCRFLNGNPSFNEDYFAEPNLESSYWAGFIAADGCIYIPKKGKNQLLVGLSEKDAEHVASLKSAIGAGNIHTSINRVQGSSKEYPQVKYQLRSNKICCDLEKNYRVTPQKTESLLPPDLVGDLAYAFIAGYIDGDGCYTHTNNTPRLSIAGTNQMLLWIDSFYGAKKIPKLYNGVYNIYYDGRAAVAVKKSFEHLPLPFLSRKKNIWGEMDSLRKYKLFKDKDEDYG